MSKFCSNCGTQISDEERFCPACGTGTATEPTASPAPIAKPNKKLFIGAVTVGAFFLFIIAIVLIVALAGGGYKRPIDNMVKGIQRGSWKTFSKAFPEDMVEAMEKAWRLGGIDGDEFIEQAVEETEDTYGKNFKITYKILDKDELSEDDLDDLKDSLEIFGVDGDKIKKAYELEIEMTYKGKKDKDTEEETLIVGKIGGKWYIIDGGWF